MSVCFVPHCEAPRLRHRFHSHKEIPNPQSRSGRAIVGLIDWRPWGGSGVKSRHVLALQRWLTRTGLWLCNQHLMPAQRASVSHRVGRGAGHRANIIPGICRAGRLTGRYVCTEWQGHGPAACSHHVGEGLCQNPHHHLSDCLCKGLRRHAAAAGVTPFQPLLLDAAS